MIIICYSIASEINLPHKNIRYFNINLKYDFPELHISLTASMMAFHSVQKTSKEAAFLVSRRCWLLSSGSDCTVTSMGVEYTPARPHDSYHHCPECKDRSWKGIGSVASRSAQRTITISLRSTQECHPVAKQYRCVVEMPRLILKHQQHESVEGRATHDISPALDRRQFFWVSRQTSKRKHRS